MRFQIGPANPATRALAALLLLSIGAAIIAGMPMPAAIPGVVIAAIACCALCAQGVMSFRQRVSRHDRYDLRLLNDAPEFRRPSRDDPECGLEAPDWEAETDDALYCHRCDGALPAGMVICPGCGAHLG